MAYPYPQTQAFPPVDSSLQGAPGAPTGPVLPAPQGVPAPAAPVAPMPGQQTAVNPALLASVLGLQTQGSQLAAADRSRKMADQLRADAQGQLQGQQAGRIYKSSGLANLAASIAANYGAGQMNQNAGAQTGAADTQRIAAMNKYFQALTGGKPDAGTTAPGDSWQ